MPDVLFLRVSTGNPDKDLAYTLVRNKAHRNVGFMFKESERRELGKDTLTAYPDLLGSYPKAFRPDVRPVKGWQVHGSLNQRSGRSQITLAFIQ